MVQRSLVEEYSFWKIAGAAVVGAAGGLLGTMVMLGSFEAGILAAIGGAIAMMIGAGMTLERTEG